MSKCVLPCAFWVDGSKTPYQSFITKICSPSLWISCKMPIWMQYWSWNPICLDFLPWKNNKRRDRLTLRRDTFHSRRSGCAWNFLLRFLLTTIFAPWIDPIDNPVLYIFSSVIWHVIIVFSNSSNHWMMAYFEVSLRRDTSMVQLIVVSNSGCWCKKRWIHELPISGGWRDESDCSPFRRMREDRISWASSRIKECHDGFPIAIRRLTPSSAFSSGIERCYCSLRDSTVDFPPFNRRPRVTWLTLYWLPTSRIDSYWRIVIVARDMTAYDSECYMMSLNT